MAKTPKAPVPLNRQHTGDSGSSALIWIALLFALLAIAAVVYAAFNPQPASSGALVPTLASLVLVG